LHRPDRVGDSSTTLHEPLEKLRSETVDAHRAIVSLMEELEAIDWYAQRVDATADPALREVLAHNRDEEKEHAAMTLEWLRRHDPVFDRHLRKYLFSEGSIVEQEHETGDLEEARRAPGGALGLGALRGMAR
jgi:ferritin-like protein